MNIKIKDWKELDEVKNDKYVITEQCIRDNSISICNAEEYGWLCRIDVVDTPEDIILKVLSAYGFDVEIEKPIVLTEREWHLVNYLPLNWWIARDKTRDSLNAYSIYPERTDKFWRSTDSIIEIDTDCFPFITWESGKAWSVEELRKLEVKE